MTVEYDKEENEACLDGEIAEFEDAHGEPVEATGRKFFFRA